MAQTRNRPKTLLISIAAFVALALFVLLGLQSVAVAKPYLGNSLAKKAGGHWVKVDPDEDGLTNEAEIKRTRTKPNVADTDRDGLTDGVEVNRTKTNPRKADTDGDGVNDGDEVRRGTDPRKAPSAPTPPTTPPWIPPIYPPPASDSTPPNTEIGSGPSGNTTATNTSFSFSSSEPGSTFACQLDGSAWAPCSSPKYYTGLSAGSHQFSVRASDAAGNTDPSPAVRAWTIRKATTPPPAPTTAEAVWESPDDVQADVPVVLDGGASTGVAPLNCTWSFENQSGSVVYETRSGCQIDFTFETAGTKYIELNVRDATGSADADKQPLVVEPAETTPPPVDTTAPETTISSGPSGTTTATSASLGFSSSESGSSFECKLDAASFASCSSPKALSGLAVGSHTFSVQATDAAGNVDSTPATRTWTVEASTTPPPVDTTAPETTISSGPSGTTTATSASLGFSSSESGSSFECKLDAASFASCSSPKALSGLAVGSHTFSVQATDAAGNVDSTPATRTWTVAAEEPDPDPSSGCVAGATNATTASALTSAVSSSKNVCVTAAVGDVNFANMGKKAVTVSTEGSGSMGHLEINSTTDLTISDARFRSVTLRSAHRTTIENSTIGGTQANRVYDQLIFMPEENNDVTVRNNDIGWTKADNTGNTGYGCRCYGTLNRLKFVGNKVHDLAGDGFQGVGGSDVVIDRNEIGPVGANPESNEHSDNIQLTFNGPNTQITNNWIHHQGFYEGKNAGNSGSIYIHGGTTNSMLIENNLVETNQGRTEICGLGTGGTSRSNITIRNNTWVDGGLAFTGFPGFEWDCDSGTGNTIERNVAVDPDGGFAQDGSAGAVTIAGNLWGQPSLVTLNAERNCTSANCNPSSGPIGYRKPSGVAW